MCVEAQQYVRRREKKQRPTRPTGQAKLHSLGAATASAPFARPADTRTCSSIVGPFLKGTALVRALIDGKKRKHASLVPSKHMSAAAMRTPLYLRTLTTAARALTAWSTILIALASLSNVAADKATFFGSGNVSWGEGSGGGKECGRGFSWRGGRVSARRRLPPSPHPSPLSPLLRPPPLTAPARAGTARSPPPSVPSPPCLRSHPSCPPWAATGAARAWR